MHEHPESAGAVVFSLSPVTVKVLFRYLFR